jgi:hypothetical protein
MQSHYQGGRGNSRCRLHGGCGTGAKSVAGKAKSLAALAEGNKRYWARVKAGEVIRPALAKRTPTVIRVMAAATSRDVLRRKTKIVGIVATGANAYRRSVVPGRVMATSSAITFADGMAVRVCPTRRP